MANDLSIKFWGVRGSIATPIPQPALHGKMSGLLIRYQLALKKNPALIEKNPMHWFEDLPFVDRATFGGNTTCAEVMAGDRRYIIDMGTGAAQLGRDLFQTIAGNKGLQATILQTHLHWDHIQGWPFFPPIYLSRDAFPNNDLVCYGGMEWEETLEDTLLRQMDAPNFPVKLRKLDLVGTKPRYLSVYDRMVILDENVRILCRQLNHPQETYGYRIEYRPAGHATSQVLAFCTDHEGYEEPDPRLLDLARGADIFVTECQYSRAQYVGKHGPPRFGWGHSWPEYIARVADAAKPKKVVTMHHDPDATDVDIVDLARTIENLCGIRTEPAYEGLMLSCVW